MFSLRRRDESQYRVMLLNDDATPMEFVVYVLETYFDMTEEGARELMFQVHNNGIAECGVYSKKTATAITAQVMDFARKYQHPLQCVMEKSESREKRPIQKEMGI